MEILMIIMLAPLALALGFLLLRLFVAPGFWAVVFVVVCVLGLLLNILTAPYRVSYSSPSAASSATALDLAKLRLV